MKKSNPVFFIFFTIIYFIILMKITSYLLDKLPMNPLGALITLIVWLILFILSVILSDYSIKKIKED